MLVSHSEPITTATAGGVAAMPENPVPDISIISSLFNRLELTQAYLRSLESTLPSGFRYEIILIDDLSTDGTREYISTLPSPPYRIHLNEVKRSYAANNNLGAKMARGRYLAFLNNDLKLTPGWLEPMFKLLREHPEAGGIGNIHINPRKGLIDHAGVAFAPDGLPFHSFKGRKRFPKGSYEEKLASSAACFLVERSRFLEMGGFDEHYINGSEDIDLCIRLRLAGHPVYVSYDSRIYHHVSSSPGRLDHMDANEARLMGKWRAVTSEWSRPQWPKEYFNRYARCFWRMNPRLALKALAMLIRIP